MINKGILISFTGINGTGKRRQSALLCKWFEDKGFTALEMPKIPAFSDMVFDNISKDKGYQDSTELFPTDVVHFASAIDRVRIFTPYAQKMVEQGAVMIMPEYSYCRMALAKLDRVKNLKLLSEVYDWLPDADIIFYMDIPSELAIERLRKSNMVTKDSSYFENLKSCYMDLPKYKKFIKIDASKSEKEVQNTLRQHVMEYLRNKNILLRR
ncbi:MULTISPECIES: dTMP kinase [Cytobacillus]|uniref:Thymidylate kinase-like domain-containing protein n=1 Tax=Cytobacillus oceanisediminis TaxID=665099 RepID=A0ABX3CJM1_9BACI|nr:MULTISPECIES: hypothetical protein [Cytobacillus]OHX40707.1 hypothetical protein BBV17_29080 [Cytobacillus oceanisediminis]